MSEHQKHHHPIADHIVSMLDEGKTREEIYATLSAEGHDMKFILEIVNQTAKMRTAQRMSKGLTYIVAGSILCLTSFLLAVTGLTGSDSIGMVLYGFTGVGVIVSFYGFTFIF